MAVDALIRFGPYEVDLRAGEVRKYGYRIKISGQSFAALALLLEHPGEVVTREEIRDRLWQRDTYVDFERGLNSVIKKLRAALNDDPQNPKFIETLPKKGYRFIGVLEEEAAIDSPAGDELAVTSEAIARTPPPTLTTEHVNSRRKSVLLIAVASVAILIGGIIVFLSGREHRVSQASALKKVSFHSSIAILGFKNLSSNGAADWLSTAIAQMVATELARGGKIRVIPEDAVARAKSELGIKAGGGYSRSSLRALRNNLDSDYAVDGSYLTMGDRNSGQVWLDIRIQETVSGETLTNVAVTGSQRSLFELVAHAGDELRQKLGRTVPPEGDIDWRTALPSNAEAAKLYSDGLAHLRLLDNIGARDALQRCVSLAPDFALAHAALAEAWQDLGFHGLALQSGEKALSLAADLPEDERLVIEGRYYELIDDWAGATSVYRHLLEDFPDDIESGLRLARVEMEANKLNEALTTLADLRSGPPSERNDPRIDLSEASILQRIGGYKQQQLLAEQAAAKAKSSGANLLFARAQIVKGQALDYQSHFVDARNAYSEAKQIFDSAGDRDASATALNDIGIILQKQGDLAGAADNFAKAREYFRQIGDESRLSSALLNLADVYRGRGHLQDAQDLYSSALQIARKTQHQEDEYAAMNKLAVLLYENGEFHRARKSAEDLLTRVKTEGNPVNEAHDKIILADVLRAQGELDNALSLYEQAITTFKTLGDRFTAAKVEVGYARALLARGDFERARDAIQEALATDQQIGAKGDAAADQIMIARVLLAEGRAKECAEAVRPAIDELKSEGRAVDEMEGLAVEAEALTESGQYENASRTLQLAQALHSGDWFAKFRVSVLSARVEAQVRSRIEAKRKLNALQAAARKVGCITCNVRSLTSF